MWIYQDNNLIRKVEGISISGKGDLIRMLKNI